MAPSVTRKQVAQEAGVSEATVSRVYNQPDSVAPDKLERVRSVADKLGYSPNTYASALRRKGSGVILFLEMQVKGGYQWTELRHYNAFYAEIVRTLTREAEKTLYHLRFQTVTSEKEILKIADPKNCDGVIGFNFASESSVQTLAKSGLPYVCCHHTEGFQKANRISTDNFHGGALQAKELKSKGYQKPAYITGALEDTFSHQERLRGFVEEFSLDSKDIFKTDPSIEGGLQVGKVLVDQIRKKRFDSIGVVNDLTAVGIIRALMSSGIEIPRQVAIIGYDNLPLINALPFQLTTLDLDLPQVYKKAFHALLSMMRENKSNTIKLKLKPKICKGTSI